MRHRFARSLKIAMFSLIPALVLVVIAEGASRATIERRAGVIRDSMDLHRTYALHIGRWPWSRRTATPLNSLGFADDEFPTLDEPKRCRRVVLTGDSFFFGDGVDRDSSFVGIVKRELEARAGAPCVQVFNLGVRGTTITQQARRVRQSLAQLRPDVVILGQYQNDLTDLLDVRPGDTLFAAAPPLGAHALDAHRSTVAGGTPSPEWGMVQERLGFFRPHTVRLLSYHAFSWMIEHDVARDELRHWSVLADTTRRDVATRLMERYTLAYDSLATELADAGIAFGVVIIPSKFDLLAGRFPEESLFVRLAERRAVPALRIFPLLDARRSPNPFLLYDGHLNEHGNRLVADELLRWLFDRSSPSFPVLVESIDTRSEVSS